MSKLIVKTFVLGAVLAAALTACQKERGVDNPNFDPKTKEVYASFVFNISTASAGTKQGTDATQVGTTFRGISDAKLMTMVNTNEGGTLLDGQILATDKTMDRYYDLSRVLGQGSISATNSRRVIEMSLPLRTNVMVFYGRAPVTTPYDEYGHLDKYEVTNEAGSANFQLGKRLTDYDNFLAIEKLLAGILTVIMHTSLEDAKGTHSGISATAYPTRPDGDTEMKPYGFTIAADKYPEFEWSAYNGTNSPVQTDHQLYPLEEKLKNLYVEMTTIHSDKSELRAGSGEATLRIIQDLWSVINSVRCAEPTSEAEAVAKYFAERVHLRLNRYFSTTSAVPTTGAAVTGVSFRSVKSDTDNQGEVDLLMTDSWVDKIPTSLQLSSTESGALQNLNPTLSEFPFNFNLPRGAVYTNFHKANNNGDDANKDYNYFYYPQSFDTSGMDVDGYSAGYNANNYYYPAELLYFGNSPVRVSDTEHQTSEYPATTAEWNKDTGEGANWEGWSVTHVESSTRSVAMKYNINYGVSMLETKVKYGASTLQDNKNYVVKLTDPTSNEDNQSIIVNDDSFKLTGVIIGGQPQNVGWDFLPITDPDGTKKVDGFIYDQAVPVASQKIPNYNASSEVASEPNYTVVFDNYSDGATQNKVYVALEFQNNTGKDIYGNCNIIRNGGYFYIIGELDPAAGGSISWPADGKDHVVPPYNADGTSKQITRVFVQDYKTTATFVLGQYSLQYAYLTVPDLRASSLTLGLSVDIEWQQGLNYSSVVLGGTTQTGSTPAGGGQ